MEGEAKGCRTPQQELAVQSPTNVQLMGAVLAEKQPESPRSLTEWK